MALTIMVSAPILIVGGIFMAVRTDSRCRCCCSSSCRSWPLVIGLVMSRAIPLFRAMQVKLDRINQVMRETLAGVRVIRAFVRTRHEEPRFDDGEPRPLRHPAPGQPALRDHDPGDDRDPQPVDGRGPLVRRDPGRGAATLSIGNLTAFLQYLTQILFAVADRGLHVHPRPAGGRLGRPDPRGPRHRAVDPRPGRAVRSRPDGPERGVVEFRDVEFRYPGAEEPVLRGVSFTAEPGQTTAIVGSTGSGKSTLVNLIPRFYDATPGPSSSTASTSARSTARTSGRRIGVIPQKAFLFCGTVASNLRFGDGRRDRRRAVAGPRDRPGPRLRERDGRAASTAPITQGGTNVSGGQRQRLAIARAIVKRAPIYVFDDSFSRARLRDRRPAPGRARPGARRGDA